MLSPVNWVEPERNQKLSNLYPFDFKIKNGAPGGIRTPDHLVRSQVLYPAELQARILLRGRIIVHHRVHYDI